MYVRLRSNHPLHGRITLYPVSSEQCTSPLTTTDPPPTTPLPEPLSLNMVSCPQHPQIPNRPCTCPPSPRDPDHVIKLTALAGTAVNITIICILLHLVKTCPAASKPTLIGFVVAYLIVIFGPSMGGIICWVYMQNRKPLLQEEVEGFGEHGWEGHAAEFEGPPDYEANAMLVPKNRFWERFRG